MKTYEEYKEEWSVDNCCSERDLGAVDGECPDCGSPTLEGTAVFCCTYSPITCKTCEYSRCDKYC